MRPMTQEEINAREVMINSLEGAEKRAAKKEKKAKGDFTEEYYRTKIHGRCEHDATKKKGFT